MVQKPLPPISERPAILLITLDTTRADRVGIETGLVKTPSLDALARRGVYFSQAYSVTPTTLPSHTSMLTGLYPTDHRVRDNGRVIDQKLELLTELMQARGYDTVAFVSGFPLDGQFGLSRGVDHYDDDFGGDAAERTAGDTTGRALAWLQGRSNPLFMWVHDYDPRLQAASRLPDGAVQTRPGERAAERGGPRSTRAAGIGAGRYHHASSD